MDVTIVSQSLSATNRQQEVCHFKNALKSAFYFNPVCFKLRQNNVKSPQVYSCERIVDILNTVVILFGCF